MACANALKTIDSVIRFRSKFVRGDPDQCWPWLGYCDGDGYGTFNPTRTTLHKAHRFAFVLANGTIPKGMCVCHSCDNPPCVNPAHLFLGTFADNDADRDAKGRQARGERSGLAKLTADRVVAIRAMREDGASQQAIANKFGVHQTAISSILRGRTWRHV